MNQVLLLSFICLIQTEVAIFPNVYENAHEHRDIMTTPDVCLSTLQFNLSSIPVFDLRPELDAHSSDQFPSPPQPEVMEVAKGVYVAIGYDLANTIIVETETGLVIIDTLSEATAARHLWNDYKELRSYKRYDTLMQIEAIILTHYHTDHSMGLGFWLELNRENGISFEPKIYANQDVIDGFKRFFIYSFPSISHRSLRQFGTLMYHSIDPSIIDEKNLFANSGIGPHLNRGDNASFVDPESDFWVLLDKNDFVLDIGNIELTIFHAPGETKDQIGVWYEDKEVLFVGDNFYYAFPNLYTIRGTSPRDPKVWITSLERFIGYNSKYLIGSHTLPISGKAKIENELILYRDVVGFVHDQTLRYLHKHYRPAEIIAAVEDTMPSILREGTKQEFYGTIEWSVRAVFDGYLGWFAGDASELYPSNIYDRGDGLYQVLDLMFKAAAAGDSMITVLTEYLRTLVGGDQSGDYIQVALSEERWALEMATNLASYLRESEGVDCDEYGQLMELRWDIIHIIAGRSVSANGRNYLITQYLEEKLNYIDEGSVIGDAYMDFPIDWLIELLRFKVAPENIEDAAQEWITNFKFVDSGESYQLVVRNGGVLYIDEYSTYDSDVIIEYDQNAQLIYEMNEINFKLGEFMDMTYVIKGAQEDLDDFWSRFDMDLTDTPAPETTDYKGKKGGGNGGGGNGGGNKPRKLLQTNEENMNAMYRILKLMRG